MKIAQPRSLGRKVSDEFTVPLCRERNGFIRRQPGVPRSIEILLPPENLPILEWLGIKSSKSL
jgi:hypothetical protein